jgi:1-acyl-sn-glycerol-3-phosphate acyltransferase
METITKWVQGKWFYDLAVFVIRLCAIIFYGLKVEGQDNVPHDRGVILAANHISSLDPPILGSTFPREVRFMAKKELFENRYSRALYSGLRAFPVDREKSDMSALKYALRTLKEGVGVGIFVQGTRFRKDEGAFSGAAFLASRTDVPIVPTAIWREGRNYRVQYGEPITVLGSSKDALAETTRLVMHRINDMLPDTARISNQATATNPGSDNSSPRPTNAS